METEIKRKIKKTRRIITTNDNNKAAKLASAETIVIWATDLTCYSEWQKFTGKAKYFFPKLKEKSNIAILKYATSIHYFSRINGEIMQIVEKV